MTADELHDWRTTRNLGIRDLGRRLGVEPSSIMRWERGERPMPGVWLDLALAELDRQLAVAPGSAPAA